MTTMLMLFHARRHSLWLVCSGFRAVRVVNDICHGLFVLLLGTLALTHAVEGTPPTIAEVLVRGRAIVTTSRLRPGLDGGDASWSKTSRTG